MARFDVGLEVLPDERAEKPEPGELNWKHVLICLEYEASDKGHGGDE